MIECEICVESTGDPADTDCICDLPLWLQESFDDERYHIKMEIPIEAIEDRQKNEEQNYFQQHFEQDWSWCECNSKTVKLY